MDWASKRGIYLGRRATPIHVAAYRWSGGRIGWKLPGRLAIALVDHRGAKTGIDRTSPLIYLDYGDAIAVVASRAGAPTNPAWFHNLMANPDTTVQIGAETRDIRARVATEGEREELWPQFVQVFPGYAMYQRNARGRTIPIVMLEPRPT